MAQTRTVLGVDIKVDPILIARHPSTPVSIVLGSLMLFSGIQCRPDPLYRPHGDLFVPGGIARILVLRRAAPITPVALGIPKCHDRPEYCFFATPSQQRATSTPESHLVRQMDSRHSKMDHRVWSSRVWRRPAVSPRAALRMTVSKVPRTQCSIMRTS
jgi:hypothetical protein